MKVLFGQWYRTPFGEFYLFKIEKPSSPSRDVWTLRILRWSIHFAFIRKVGKK